MSQPTLVLAGIVALLAGAAYGHVARKLRANGGSAGARRAMAMFALWWYALAANIALVGVTYLLAAGGLLTFELQLVDSYLQRFLLAVSMVGLMQYLLYLLTGRDFLLPLALVYGAHFLVTTGALFAQGPNGLFIGAWRTDLTYAHESPAWLRPMNLAFILLPPVVAALWYFRLFFRVEDATRKWRVALVSWAIVGWWGIAVLAGQRAALDDSPLQVLNRGLSLLAAFAVLAAYAPPAWARRRWGVQPLGA